VSADRFAGHTPGPWVVQQHRSEVIGFFVSWNHIALAQQASKQDAELMAAAPELLAENERLRADLARVSLELGLPPTIGPVPGQITAMRKESTRIRECLIKANSQAENFEAENERLRARVAELEGVVASLADYDAYLASQLGGAHP
jgi:hypothetical protein